MPVRLEPSVMSFRCGSAVSGQSYAELTSKTPLSLKIFMHRPMFGTSWMTEARHVRSTMSTSNILGASAGNYH